MTAFKPPRLAAILGLGLALWPCVLRAQGAAPAFTINAPLPSGTNRIGDVGLRSGSNALAINAAGAITETNGAAFSGVQPMTVGATYAAARSIGATCTAAGNASLTFSDASTLVVPVSTGFQTFPFAVVSVNAGGTTASCAFFNLK